MQIRDVLPSDFDAIARLTNHYIEHTAIHFGAEPVSAAELRAEWEEKTRGRYGFFVADVDGFAGYAKAGVFRTRAAYAWTAEVGVYVEEAKQRRGVARALYERVIDVSRRQGFHTLIAGITLPNEASVALHERMGFHSVGVFREVGFKHGRCHDVGFWQLALSQGTPAPLKSLAELP